MARIDREGGFAYLIALFTLAVSGALLGMASVVWHHEAQRARERELLRVGEEFQRAIGLYYERTPGAVKKYPDSFDQLLRDDRYLSLQRYLRRIYQDPMTGKPDWALVQAPAGGIMGVHSRSADIPIKKAGFSEQQKMLEGAATYAGWRFVYEPPRVITPPASTPPSAPRQPSLHSPTPQR